ncbi:hypothetical protein I204_01777 [Kwoniella mangroviensis CBS 8886]|nr:uncharacterized protein I203_03917 [Kwoniella mangroviensis CBS 8507]OCF67230.1 hypothetical protein I203_03917 [Kwoniella mangroviensis CBS 8507]OCF77776.1 hypothetical protein I204_01777 [Kwoniella mangroviensis CBS 8886]
MSLLASSLAGANYMTSSNEDRESATNGAAEFTRRKKWPEILLKELVGGSIFCLKPVMIRRESGQQGGPSGGGTTWSWKIIYSSPAVIEMLGKKPADLEGKDFLDLVFSADHGQVQTFFHHLLTPSLPHHASSSTSITTSTNSPNNNSTAQNTLGDSQTTYIRMLSSSSSSVGGSNDNSPESSSNGSNDTSSSTNKKIGPVIWEIRAHASGLGDDMPLPPGTENLTMTSTNGTLTTTANVPGENGNGMRGKAIWVMGRRVSENFSDLDAFLELKLENERLREELRELQLDLDEELPYEDSSPSSSRSSSPSRVAGNAGTSTKPKGKTGRPPKEGKDKEKKRKKSSAGGVNGKEGEGMHVCVTCGRTDSPEWRKGPLGPKTLCNACGLRWAKRNSNQPTRKKPNEVKK